MLKSSTGHTTGTGSLEARLMNTISLVETCDLAKVMMPFFMIKCRSHLFDLSSPSPTSKKSAPFQDQRCVELELPIVPSSTPSTWCWAERVSSHNSRNPNGDLSILYSTATLIPKSSLSKLSFHHRHSRLMIESRHACGTVVQPQAIIFTSAHPSSRSVSTSQQWKCSVPSS